MFGVDRVGVVSGGIVDMLELLYRDVMEVTVALLMLRLEADSVMEETE